MEKHFILFSFYYYVCVNKKWTKCAKFSFSKYLHSDRSWLRARTWHRESRSGGHYRKNIRVLLVRVAWSLTQLGPFRYIVV